MHSKTSLFLLQIADGAGIAATFTLFGSSFSSCSSTTGEGGALHIKLCSEGKLLFNPEYLVDQITTDETLFTSCAASEGYGGGVYVQSAGLDTNLVVKNVKFNGETCTCKEGKGGRVYVSCTDGSALFAPEKWIGTVDEYDDILTSYYWTTETKDSNTNNVSILSHPRTNHSFSTRQSSLNSGD